MATDTKVKRERLIDRSYDDVNGKATASDSKTGDALFTFSLADVAKAIVNGGAIRYVMDGAVSIFQNAMKQDGMTPEKALELVQEYFDSMAEGGDYKFRAGAGEGGLSLEQEFDVIAKVLVQGELAKDDADARAKIQAYYDVVRTRKQTIKGKERTVEDHPEYNKIKRIPQVRDALTKAQGDTSADQLKSLFAPPPAATTPSA